MKTLYYFSAPWCKGCESLDPMINQVISRGIPVEKVNIDYELDRAKKANIQSIPTVILVENGQEKKRFTGAKSLDFIIQFYHS